MLVMVCFDFVNMSFSEYSYQNVLLFLIYLPNYNYFLRNYLFVMFFVYMMVLLLVEKFANPFVIIFSAKEGFTVDLIIVCCSVGFFCCFGVVKLGRIGEMFCCASVVVIVLTTSPSTKKGMGFVYLVVLDFLFRLTYLDLRKCSLNYYFLLIQERMNYI